MRIKHAWLKSTSTATTYGRFHLDADGYVVDVTDVHPKMKGVRPTAADIRAIPGFSVEETIKVDKPVKPPRDEKPKAEVKEPKPEETAPSVPVNEAKPADAESNVAVE